MSQDYYEILQVHPRADSVAVMAAYTRLCDLYDPARLDGAAEELVELARQKRDAIERAYAVLADPVRRAAYDVELAAIQSAPSVIEPSNAAAIARRTPDDAMLDYRPLPPTVGNEGPRNFDDQPSGAAVRDEQSPRTSLGRWPALVGLTGLLALVVAISLWLTGGGGPPAAPPAPTASPFDQFEALIPQAGRAAEQYPTNPRAWIDYGNILYDSVQVVHERAPDSPLYQQRLPRWLQATEAYSRALTLQPDNAAVRADLGASACFYGAGMGDQEFVRTGLSEVQHAAQRAPNDPRVLLSLGYCLVSKQPPQTEEALANWRRIVQVAPPDSSLVAQAQQLIVRYSSK